MDKHDSSTPSEDRWHSEYSQSKTRLPNMKGAGRPLPTWTFEPSKEY